MVYATAGALLTRAGLIVPRRRRRPTTHPGVVDPVTAAPNDLCTADGKGPFRTGDGIYCYPLTIAAQHTRVLLTCHGLPSVKSHEARRVFARACREHGMPRAIRTDNGVPFVTRGLGGLSTLTVWWLRLGIPHQRLHPASPQENGAHARMHRTLTRGAIHPPRATARAQQRAFDAFRHEYNTERPHSPCGGAPPATQYAPSPRPYPSRLPPLEYPAHFVVKRVTDAGTIRVQNRLLFASTALEDYRIGLDEVADGIWSIWSGETLLARCDERDSILQD